jgi:hypothetical protein
MKNLFLLLFGLIFIFSNCKEDKTDPVEFNGIYEVLTKTMIAQHASTVNISGNTFQFEGQESYLYSHKPTSNQNVFYFSSGKVTNTDGRIVGFRVFIPPFGPEEFFHSGSLPIDLLTIEYAVNDGSGFVWKYDDFHNVNAVLNWETASYVNKTFKGAGSLVLSKPLVFKNESTIFFPAQTIEFKFE